MSFIPTSSTTTKSLISSSTSPSTTTLMIKNQVESSICPEGGDNLYSERQETAEGLLSNTQEALGNISFSTIKNAVQSSPKRSSNIVKTYDLDDAVISETKNIFSKKYTLSPEYKRNLGSSQTQQQTPPAEGNNSKADFTEDSTSKSSDSSSLNVSGEALKTTSPSEQIEKPKSASKISERAKKKSWYNVIYPSYKSRSKVFKKLFKEVPNDERLIVDYSCALQRDILVHGRLYVSQNYLCFYANIFRWETYLTIKWKDVTSITKEKTALVIPNAISVCTEKDKHFFASFTTRDKAFLMLFRVWQNTLMNKPMLPQEMWQWVHNCYGDELGLTTDDEDYIDPLTIEDLPKEIDSSVGEHNSNDPQKVTPNTTSSSDKTTSDTNSGGGTGSEKDKMSVKEVTKFDESLSAETVNGVGESTKRKVSKNSRQRDESLNKNSETLPTDMSDSSDSEENNIPFVSTVECTSTHEGRQLVHTILPINIDTLFNLLFSKSKFLLEFHELRKSTDLFLGDWVTSSTGVKTRTVNLTVMLAQSVGPKSSKVTESQVMRDCSKPGELYSIDIDSTNAGIPYADSFGVLLHYCLVKTIDDNTMLSVHAQIKYKKSIWGVVKGFIEKNAWAGLEDFYSALLRALQSETCIPPAKGKGRRPRKGTTASVRPSVEEIPPVVFIPEVIEPIIPIPVQVVSEPTINYKWMSISVIILLFLLILINVILLLKLWRLEDRIQSDLSTRLVPNLSQIKNLPNNHEDWIDLLKQQEQLHDTELKKWHTVLQTAIELLKKTENVLAELLYINLFQSTKISASI
ncbi:protein Aster-B isoform X2 [Episyrphus balteatus]|uniref:protein Aster-B isoform X2 n=1 Tax=Episyrphus balteatus TaxID=286459 RepID=UPI002486B09E|nr:protein Aster-B isoform X2 [Episyrphus balteatus]